jgi:hypothetical protein
MRRIVTLLAVLLLVGTGFAVAQTYTWQHMGVFPPAGLAPGDTIFGGDVHGVAVDPLGRVWIQRFGIQKGDSITVPNFCADLDTTVLDSIVSRKIGVRALHVYNPNGTEASFSPIFYANVGSVHDTLGGASTFVKGVKVWHPAISPNSGRGLRKDQNGNIIATYFGNIYRFNYQTGAAMNKGIIDAANSGVAVGVSSTGYVYGNIVVCQGKPLKIFNPDLTFLQNAVDTLKGITGSNFSRAIEVSADEKDIYFSGYTNHAVFRYHSDLGVLGSYLTRVDTVLKGFDTESFGWNPNGRLFASAGSYNDMPNRWPGLTTAYETGAWYAYNPTSNTVLGEHITWVYKNAQSPDERPRGIAFSPNGDTAYVCIFGSNTGVPGVRRYHRTLTSVEPIDNLVPAQFELMQNYPNPFNPSTEIRFTVPASGMVTLKVFDVLGREITTLVNEVLAPGTYRSTLDGARLASGTYIYTLTSGNNRIAKKMLLLK